MRYEDKEGGRPKETGKENEKKRKTWWYREEGEGELDEKKKLPVETEKHIVKKREKETRERQKRETERAVKSEFGRNE